MEEGQDEIPKPSEAEALDVEFLPLVILHKIHKNLKSSQVEVVPQIHYVRESTPESEIEMEGEMEAEVAPTHVVYAPPLPALKERKNWWDFIRPIYAFNDPRIRTRIELLMTSRIVYVLERRYMVKLQEKIKENFSECLIQRIRARVVDELERQKRLLLSGKITYEEAPSELKNHPVCRINNLSQRIISNKTDKMKKIDKTSAYRTSPRRIKVMEKIMEETFSNKDVDRHMESSQISSVCVVDAPPNQDIEMGLMFSQEDYERLKFEDPLIKRLREVDGIAEMYELADTLFGKTNNALN